MKITKSEDLVKEQIKTIDKLQEKIKLQQFDITQLNKENGMLREKLKRRKENIKNIRVELERMKRKNDFSEINNVLMMSTDGWDKKYDDDEE